MEDEHEASHKDAERGLSQGRAVSGERVVSARIIRLDRVFGRDRWDQSGEVDGDICGLIEGAEIERPITADHVVVKKGNKKMNQ